MSQFAFGIDLVTYVYFAVGIALGLILFPLFAWIKDIQDRKAGKFDIIYINSAKQIKHIRMKPENNTFPIKVGTMKLIYTFNANTDVGYLFRGNLPFIIVYGPDAKAWDLHAALNGADDKFLKDNKETIESFAAKGLNVSSVEHIQKRPISIPIAGLSQVVALAKFEALLGGQDVILKRIAMFVIIGVLVSAMAAFFAFQNSQTLAPIGQGIQNILKYVAPH